MPRSKLSSRTISPRPMRTSDILIELVPGEDGAGGEYRTVSERIVVGRVPVPSTQERSTRRWRRKLSLQVKDPGDIEVPYASSVAKFPAANELLESVSSLVQEHGIPDFLEKGDVTVVGCKGAYFHHDISGFSDSVFCIIWMEKARGLDLVFPDLGRRVPLEEGTVVLFDAAQPHAVLKAGKTRFDSNDFLDVPVQVLISINVEVDVPGIAQSMGIKVHEEDGWGGVIVQMTSNGPQLDRLTGKWKTSLTQGLGPVRLCV